MLDAAKRPHPDSRGMVPTGCHPLAERSGLLEQAELLKQWPPLRRQHLEDQTALDGETLAEVVDGHIIQIADRSAGPAL